MIFPILTQCQDIERPPFLSLLFVQSTPGNIGMVSSDFGGGGRYNVLDPRNGFVLPGLTPIHSDAVVRFQNDSVYIINRLGQDSIQILDPNLANLTQIEYSVGSGSNPQDILIISPEKAYVSRNRSPSMLIINPQNGAVQKELNLARFAETSSPSGAVDGLPEMGSLIRYENRVFLTLQRLDRNDPSGFFPPTDKSLLIEIDSLTDSIIREYNFQSTNPTGKPQILEIFGAPHIIYPTPGYLGFISRLDGGVEAFNLRTNQFRPGFLLEERIAGGDILSVQIANSELGFASVLDSAFNKKIISFNPSNGSVLQNLIDIPNSVSTNFSGLLLTRDSLLIVGVRDFSGSGVIVFNVENGVRRITPVPIPTELTPFDFVELVNEN